MKMRRTLKLEELSQIAEIEPGFLVILARCFGLSVQELRRGVEQGAFTVPARFDVSAIVANIRNLQRNSQHEPSANETIAMQNGTLLVAIQDGRGPIRGRCGTAFPILFPDDLDEA